MHQIHTLELKNPIDNQEVTVSFSSPDALKIFAEMVTTEQPATYFEQEDSAFRQNLTRLNVRKADIYDSADEAFQSFTKMVASAARKRLGTAGLKALGITDPACPFD